MKKTENHILMLLNCICVDFFDFGRIVAVQRVTRQRACAPAKLAAPLSQVLSVHSLFETFALLCGTFLNPWDPAGNLYFLVPGPLIGDFIMVVGGGRLFPISSLSGGRRLDPSAPGGFVKKGPGSTVRKYIRGFQAGWKMLTIVYQ